MPRMYAAENTGLSIFRCFLCRLSVVASRPGPSKSMLPLGKRSDDVLRGTELYNVLIIHTVTGKDVLIFDVNGV